HANGRLGYGVAFPPETATDHRELDAFSDSLKLEGSHRLQVNFAKSQAGTPEWQARYIAYHTRMDSLKSKAMTEGWTPTRRDIRDDSLMENILMRETGAPRKVMAATMITAPACRS